MLSLQQRLHFIAISIGCFSCYSIFGIIQESIFKRTYVSDDKSQSEQFTFALSFVWVQCLFYTLFAKAILLTHNHTPNETTQGYYVLTAVFYCVANVTSNAALQFIAYPVQVVGKALKPIPTVIFGFLVGGKSYPNHKYFFVLLIVSGAIMFLYKADRENSGSSNIGYALVGVSLLMNGFTAGLQEKMRSVKRPSTLNFMMFINLWSSIFLTACVIVTGETFSFISFCTRHPEILIQIGVILVVGSCGQLFTSAMIMNYGVVPCCLVMTIRKFFNVFFSVLYFGNSLSIRQGIAAVIIFMSLLADCILSARLPKSVGKDSEKCDKSDNKDDQEKIKQIQSECLLEQ